MQQEISVDVITAIADHKGIDPVEIDFKLNDYINPDIIDQVVTSDTGSTTLTFEVPGHEVTVTNEGAILVDGHVYHHGKDPFNTQINPATPTIRTANIDEILTDDIPGYAYKCKNQPEWPIEYISPGCKEITGIDRETFLHGAVSFGVDLIHPDDQQDVWNDIQPALTHNEPYTTTYRLTRPDGGTRHVFETGRGIYDDETDEVESLIGITVDITDLTPRDILRQRSARA